MAKRIPGGPADAPERPDGTAPARCRVCGGPVLVEETHRAERYPRRLKCVRCDAEYGTTRPPIRNY